MLCAKKFFFSDKPTVQKVQLNFKMLKSFLSFMCNKKSYNNKKNQLFEFQILFGYRDAFR